MIKLKLLYEADPKGGNKIFMPATLKDENQNSTDWQRWKLSYNDPVYIGRRLQCNDNIRTSLTLGFFPRLQVSFHEIFGSNAGYTLAQNTIAFLDNGMEIKLEYSGEIGFDIDILVKSPKSKERTLEFVQKNIIKHIIDLCADKILGCQGVVLVEGILQPECVMSLTPCKYRKQHSVLVETLKQKVLTTSDLDYRHCWESEPDISLEYGSNKAMDLLGGHEWEDVLDRFYKNLGEIHGLFKLEKNPIIEESKLLSYRENPSCSQVEHNFSGMIKYMGEIHAHSQEMHAELVRHFDNLGQRTNHMIALQDKIKLELFSKMDQVIDFSWKLQSHIVPRYVYFTTVDVHSGVGTIVTKIMPGMKRLQLHLMCEHKDGFHKVQGQDGIALTITNELAQKILPILKWSVKIIALLIKVGAHVAAGMGNMIPELDKMAIYSLDAGALDQVALNVVDNNIVSRGDVDSNDQPKKAATEWLIKVLGEHPRIAKLFDLYKIKYEQGNEVAWVCSKHKQHGVAL